MSEGAVKGVHVYIRNFSPFQIYFMNFTFYVASHTFSLNRIAVAAEAEN